jgi:hypothetical protein
MEVIGQIHDPAAFPREKSLGGWMGARASLDTVKKINLLPVPAIEPRPPT